MKSWMMVGVGLLMTGAAGVALAQQAPAAPPLPPPGGPAAQPPGGPDGPRGPMAGRPGEGPGDGRFGDGRGEGWGWHGPRGMHHEPPPPPPSKAAFFRLRKGDASIMVKCAENEPMKACVDAAGALLDKAAASK